MGVEPKSRSLFHRLARYAPHPGSQPRENSLTEALATVLDNVAGTPELVAKLWCDGLPSGDWRVETQALTGNGFERIDLVLSHPGALVWVEIKHGAPLHENQLKNYRDALDRRSGSANRALILLVPEGFDLDNPDTQHADAVSTWQDTGVALHESQPCLARDPERRWLLSQFIAFLKEEDLVVTDPLSHDHLEAVLMRRPAETSFSELLRRTQKGIIERRREQPKTWPDGWPTPKQRGDWPTFWAIWKPPAWGGTARLEWAFNDETGAWLFGAGVTIDDGTDGGEVEWLSNLATSGLPGFEEMLGFQGVIRLFRRMDPRRLVGLTNPDTQSRKLCDWVVETFDELERASGSN